jgi:hypothetical protein
MENCNAERRVDEKSFEEQAMSMLKHYRTDFIFAKKLRWPG